jgi:hypothetical protein
LQQPSTTWCMKPKPSQSQMSSLLERLPPELFSQICSTIQKSQAFNRQYHSTFLNLSLVSRKCRSYSTPYIFDRLFLKESCLGDSATSLENCISTLAGLNVLNFVGGIDVMVPVAGGKCKWEYERDSVVGLLDKLPNLTRLYIRTSDVLTEELVDEVQQVLLHCSSRLEAEKSFDHYWWWYFTKSQDRARIFRDGDPASMFRCRLVKLFGGRKQRSFVFAHAGIRPRPGTQYVSSSSRLTYLFLLD